MKIFNNHRTFVEAIFEKWYFFDFPLPILCLLDGHKSKKILKISRTYCKKQFSSPKFFSENHFKPFKIDIKNSSNLHFWQFLPFLVQNGCFSKISNLYTKIEKPILIFLKKIMETKPSIYNVFFQFLAIFPEKKHFNGVFMYHFEKIKKTDFCQKTCGFYAYFEIVF